jgi:hypothetical protein
MPSLQLHQLRVAAVGKLICENFNETLKMNDVILACLFHDMGNILKFDLTVFPESVQPEGLSHWEAVKVEYRNKYGTDQHAASIAIAREIGLSNPVIECIDLIAFSKAAEVLAGDSYEAKICEYSDSRVGPLGVMPLEERLRDGRKRYLNRADGFQHDMAKSSASFEAGVQLERKLEQQIFAHAAIKPEDITSAAVVPIVEELWEYPVA